MTHLEEFDEAHGIRMQNGNCSPRLRHENVAAPFVKHSQSLARRVGIRARTRWLCVVRCLHAMPQNASISKRQHGRLLVPLLLSSPPP